MATVTVGGTPQNTIGSLPAVGSRIPDFNLTAGDLSDKSAVDFEGSSGLAFIPAVFLQGI